MRKNSVAWKAARTVSVLSETKICRRPLPINGKVAIGASARSRFGDRGLEDRERFPHILIGDVVHTSARLTPSAT